MMRLKYDVSILVYHVQCPSLPSCSVVNDSGPLVCYWSTSCMDDLCCVFQVYSTVMLWLAVWPHTFLTRGQTTWEWDIAFLSLILSTLHEYKCTCIRIFWVPIHNYTADEGKRLERILACTGVPYFRLTLLATLSYHEKLGKCSKSVQSHAEDLWRMHRHWPVILQCTDSIVFPKERLPNRYTALYWISCAHVSACVTGPQHVHCTIRKTCLSQNCHAITSKQDCITNYIKTVPANMDNS